MDVLEVKVITNCERRSERKITKTIVGGGGKLSSAFARKSARFTRHALFYCKVFRDIKLNLFRMAKRLYFRLETKLWDGGICRHPLVCI